MLSVIPLSFLDIPLLVLPKNTVAPLVYVGAVPTTWNTASGLSVPIPTLPSCEMRTFSSLSVVNIIFESVAP